MNPNGAKVDIISAQGGKLTGTGDVATRLMQSGFNINALRTNDVLRKDEWQAFDTTLIDVARQKLVLSNLLASRGLTYNIPNGLGTTILEWENVSDMEPADVSMAGVTRGEQDTLEFNLQSMPLPIIHKDFTINVRKLEASRTLGMPLDMAQAELAMRLVMETIEDMIIDGHATRVGSSQIFGLRTETNRNTGSQTADWDAAATGAQILADVLAMMALAHADHYYGPFTILVNYSTWRNMMEDYSANYEGSMLKRILEVPDVEAVLPSSNVPASESLMVQLTRDVIDQVVGLQPTVVQWETQGGMQLHFKVMAIMIPRVRSTQTLQSGIIHYS